MKVVVIGARGMLGRAVMDACQAVGWEVAGYDLPGLDITKMDGREVEDTDWVVNCAAYTNVDAAEDDATKCFEVNACGAGRVARMCHEQNWRLLHVSTDYVFNGQSALPYDEYDPICPLNVYGKSKWMGEELVSSEHPTSLIVRTQSLFGNHGVNFVQKILKKVEEGQKELGVVSDQDSCPTYVGHLAIGMRRLMLKEAEGVVHVSAEDVCSWAEFAKAILDERGLTDVRIKPMRSDEFKASRAIRPKQSALCKARYTILTETDMPSWRQGLNEYLASRK
jgi:dTDP-4-dehydrorhamnose reductase